eukprot:TRINITY_DN1100_c0_g1_i1.p2 TRINITY_DN1100_c0_g1~~TRINITY_DN1100_c0_g1_i1.p2  ORF type:complete len:459 (-),score=124.76 TRINITY_DN1100_c0_g1_i1:52-1428(-)
MSSSTPALLIRFLLFTGLAIYAAEHNCNCVVFRLDDVQDYYIAGAQRAIMDVFKEEKIPMTAGIISYYFGADSTQVNYIKTALRVPDWDFEVANHGWYHEYFDDYTLEEQRDLFGNALNKTLRILNPLVTEIPTFIPPMNAYNRDTLTVLSEFGFKAMSSMVALDKKGKYPFKAEEGIFRWPIDAATSDMSFESAFIPISAEASMAEIQRQLQRDGFASVMMHPQEYSILDSNNAPTDDVNWDHIDELRVLIQMVRDAGIKFTTFRNLPQEFGLSTGSGSASSTSTSGSTSGSTSTSATSTSTSGNGEPLTTGVNQPITTGEKVTTGLKPLTTGASPLTTSPLTSGAAPLTTGATPLTTGASPVTSGAAPLTTGGSGGSPPVTPTTEAVTTEQATTGLNCTPGTLGCPCDTNGECGEGAVCNGLGICSSFSVEDGAAGSIAFSGILTFAAFAVTALLS